MKFPEFDECLRQKKIVRSSVVKKAAARELKVALDDLATAQKSLRQRNYKWATIQAYYTMFHAARTLLYYKGYREKSHYCLILAMKALYVSEGLLELRLVESFQMAKVLRENADYDNTFDRVSAKELVGQAREFVACAEDALGA